jgi:hypothetical protein
LQVIPPTSNVTDDKVRYAFGIHCVWLKTIVMCW